jgi:hypothetical protein
MHPNVYYTVIAPTLVTGSAFVGITTLGDDTNYVGKIINAVSKRTNKKIFKTIELTLVCNDCLKAGKAKECIHKLGEIPYWQDDDRHKDLQEIMKEREEDYLRETKGINSNSWVTPAFSKTALLDIYKSPKVDVTFAPFVFTSADPNAGGTRSRFAIISSIYDNENIMVVSILFLLLISRIAFH